MPQPPNGYTHWIKYLIDHPDWLVDLHKIGIDAEIMDALDQEYDRFVLAEKMAAHNLKQHEDKIGRMHRKLFDDIDCSIFNPNGEIFKIAEKKLKGTTFPKGVKNPLKKGYCKK
ncbi:MAG: hypothetical protein WC511_01855 [Candidatus Pacearchaeota archaeon]